MNDGHLIDLEIKIAHHEVAIEELQQTVYEQHLTIEKLQKGLESLSKRLQGLISGDDEIGPANEKPPHY